MERFFESADGLEIYYRDYAPPEPGGLPILCLHGLTRNSRDFESIASVLNARHRVIAFDFRGRGRSDYDPDWSNYHPAQYVTDVWKLIDILEIDRMALIGTSLGGMMSVLMQHERPDAIAGVVLNDVGPRLDPDGIARVVANAGKLPISPDRDGAITATRENYGHAYPDWDESQWQWFADITYQRLADGRYDLNFDRNIGVAARKGVSGLRTDPWQLFAKLKYKPVLLVHGALSDILTNEIVAEMRDVKTDLEVVVVPNRGHAPVLDEPEAQNAILEFMERLD
ncbi:MAG: alpha/beta fold hydrolase [Gammaproteobacteria bacterium]